MRRIKLMVSIIISFILRGCSYFITRKTNWIVFGSWCGENYIDNPRYIYEYLMDQKDETKLIWIGTESIRIHVPQNEKTLFVKKGSIKAIYYLLRAKYIFISQMVRGDLTSLNVYENAIIIHCWHGVPLKKIGSHMHQTIIHRTKIEQSIRNIGKNILGVPIQYNYFISSSPKNDKVFQSAFSSIGATSNNMLHSGYPRNDMFFNLKKDEIDMLKEKYSKILDIPMNKKVVLYLPTYRRKADSIETLCNRNKKELKDLNDLLEKHQAILIEKNHFQTYEKVKMDYNSSLSNSLIKLSPEKQINIQEILLFTDILISDYSGAFLDFTLLDRPIIHYAYDYDYYKDIDSGLYYNIEEFAAGKVATTFPEVIEELEQLLTGNDLYKSKREQVRKDFMTYEEGHACEYVCQKVLK